MQTPSRDDDSDNIFANYVQNRGAKHGDNKSQAIRNGVKKKDGNGKKNNAVFPPKSPNIVMFKFKQGTMIKANKQES